MNDFYSWSPERRVPRGKAIDAEETRAALEDARDSAIIAILEEPWEYGYCKDDREECKVSEDDLDESFLNQEKTCMASRVMIPRVVYMDLVKTGSSRTIGDFFDAARGLGFDMECVDECLDGYATCAVPVEHRDGIAIHFFGT